MEKLQLVVPQFVSISRSFSRKIQLENAGIPGHKYESTDFFCSYNEQLEVEKATPEAIAELSNKLYASAKADVERAIENYINELKGGATSTFPNMEDLEKVAPFIARLVSGEDIDKIQEDIVKVKDILSDSQKDILRNIILKKKNKII